MEFVNNNGNYSVRISDIILDQLHNECNKSPNMETGGIIFGNYSVDNSITTISSITGPPTDSEHGWCTFYRGTKGLDKITDEEWKQGHYYIGEWHYHPNNSPEPSKIDDEGMKKFAVDKALKCPKPILLIIGGNQDMGWDLSVHIYTEDEKIFLTKKVPFNF